MNDALGINNPGQIAGEANFQAQQTHGFILMPTSVIGDATGDGTVNADDVVAVIAGWGPCPNPPKQCAADVNDDGLVNADDLVLVVLNWSSRRRDMCCNVTPHAKRFISQWVQGSGPHIVGIVFEVSTHA